MQVPTRALLAATLLLAGLWTAQALARELPKADPARDRLVLQNITTLSKAMLAPHVTWDNSFAYDHYVPCLPYANAALGTFSQRVINEHVNVDARGRKLGILGKLDYHGAYKGRDRLRDISLDAALDLLADPPPGREMGYRLLKLCALTTRFEHANVDYEAAAAAFIEAYRRLADDHPIYDLPLMNALSGAEFWAADRARGLVAALGVARAEGLPPDQPLRKALLLAYASLAMPRDEDFVRIASTAERTAGTQAGALVRVMIYPRYRQTIPPVSALQLELTRMVFSSAALTPELAAFLHPDHADRAISAVIETYLDIIPLGIPADVTDAEWQHALDVSAMVQAIHRQVRDVEQAAPPPRSGGPISKSATYNQYHALDFNRFTGRSRIQLERRLEASGNIPLFYGQIIAKQLYEQPDVMNPNALAVYNPAYRDVIKYARMRLIGYALELYDRTGEEVYMDMAMQAVQRTFLNLADLSRRWIHVRALARNPRDQRLVEQAQANMFTFENELFALAQTLIDVPLDDRRETLLRLHALEEEYRQITREFHNRHQTYQEVLRRLPEANAILRGDAPHLADVRQHLADDEAVIYMTRVDDEYLGFLVRKNLVSVALGRRPMAEVDEMIDRMLRNLVPQPGGRGYAPFDREAARDLYEFALAPFDEELADVRQLVWIAPDSLAGLSPAVFVDRNDTMVFDRMTVTLSVSLANFVEARRATAAQRGARFAVLGVGASQSTESEIACLLRDECPVSGGGRFRSFGAGSLLDLAPLPETATELVAMRQALEPVDATLLLGPEARIEQLQPALRNRYDVVSFATHGVSAHRLESIGLIEPALLLGQPRDGRSAFLSVSEIARLDLKGRPIVVLSACDTSRAGNGSLHFDALSGFYQAFRLAGAEGVVATQWEVASDAATRLIPDYVARVRRGQPFAAALRDAALQLRDSVPPSLQHPGYWAPFVYLGDGAGTL